MWNDVIRKYNPKYKYLSLGVFDFFWNIFFLTNKHLFDFLGGTSDQLSEVCAALEGLPLQWMFLVQQQKGARLETRWK